MAAHGAADKREGFVLADVWTTSRLAADAARPGIRRIAPSELRAVLRAGWEDFRGCPTQLVFLCVLYPIVGLVAARAFSGGEMLPLLWPLIAGLSLVGPVAAVGLYEISRRREAGEKVSWLTAFQVLRHPNLPQIAMLGIMLMAIFVAWIAVAKGIYMMTMGHLPAPQAGGLWQETFGTAAGWRLLLIGNAVGFVFALGVLMLTVISVPMLIDRPVGIGTAIQTSIRACLENPRAMAAWGVIVAAALLVGSLPAFIGLAVAMPVLGHATWHLYKRVVA
ncbi:DUF2189 domain-containing protein [Paracraurococcus ruber]|uniref:DUF2189 domain-containing protein n=1 Tax=Paracraurococcus ruber TaxID=77675 RepID=A0ABS1CXJ4_9PROT|nr:DUF2189 domain-containing protein [Paracraurococcus ruber]MBK1659202.1 hypothetical protein [Paracraurococcus ruber]TDG30634.1 DUF2189 domain-containing protein [Paracraurococcus ruber]